MTAKNTHHKGLSSSTICEDIPLNEIGSLPKWWRPKSFSRSLLAGTLLACLALLATIVILQHMDRTNGAILFATTSNDFSDVQSFLFRYLPTILVVAFSLLISTIDLDVKRLAPWHDLSTGKVRRGVSPLLCRYDTDFVLTVIAAAMKDRYWVVLLSSILFALSTIIVPAVQNSMFATREMVRISKGSNIGGPGTIVDLDAQSKTMTSNFLNTAYSVTWLGQDLPAFTTMNEAFAPLSLESTDHTSFPASITSATTRYWAELQCWSPSVVAENATSDKKALDNGRGCVVSEDIFKLLESATPRKNDEYGCAFFGSQNSRRYLEEPDLFTAQCPQFFHLMMVAWRRMSDQLPDFEPGGDATAIFCQPEYYLEPVEVTVDGTNGTVEAFRSTGAQEILSEQMFNRSLFESIITNGASPALLEWNNLSALTVDIADGSFVGTTARMYDLGVTIAAIDIAGFMESLLFGLTRHNRSAYLDPTVLSEALQKAHKLSFALAMSNNFVAANGTRQEAQYSSSVRSLHLVPGFAIATEVLLVIMSLLICYLLLMLPKRYLTLRENPDSFASLISLIQSPCTQDVFSNLSNVTDKDMKIRIVPHVFKLVLDEHQHPLLLHAACTEASTQEKYPHIASESRISYAAKHLPEISWSVSGVITSAIAAATILLCVLQVKSESQGGLPLPSSNVIILQAMFNLLPTVLATLLGAYLALVCRVHSFMMPIEELYRGNAAAESTLLVNYTSYPPSMLFPKATRSRHYLLAALSIVALLSNVLTVTMASIFMQDEGLAYTSTSLLASAQPVVIRGRQSFGFDTYYTTIANLSGLTSLPPWTSQNYGYLPLTGMASAQPATDYEVESFGYGADLQCADFFIPADNFSANFDVQLQDAGYISDIGLTSVGGMFRLLANYTLSDGGTEECTYDHMSSDRRKFGQINGAVREQISAFEISNLFQSVNHQEKERSFCGNVTIKGWVRGWLAEIPKTATSNLTHEIKYNATVISCMPRLKMQKSRLRVSPAGQILSEIAIDQPSYDIPPTVNLSATLATALLINQGKNNQPIWHTDTIARDWPNYLYKKSLQSSDWLDASKPLPSAEFAAKIVSDTFSRTFAVRLYVDQRSMLPANTSARSVSTWDTSQLALDAPGDSTISAKVTYSTRRIFISKPNFIISVAILALDLIVLVTFRLRLSEPFLPRAPFTIASQIAFFAGSHVIDDVVRAGGDLKELDRKGYRYGYGRFIGKDGRVHIGIEREPFVHKLYESNRGNSREGLWQKLSSVFGNRRRTPGSVKIGGHEFHTLPGHDRSRSSSR